MRGAWAGTSASVPKLAATLLVQLPYNSIVGDSFTRVAVDSNLGQIVLYVWSPVLFVLSAIYTVRTRRAPVALITYTIVVAALMMTPVPKNVWMNSYFLYVVALSLMIHFFQCSKAESLQKKFADAGSRLAPCAPLLLGLTFAIQQKGASQIEVQGSSLECAATPKNLSVQAGKAETFRQNDFLELTSYLETDPGSLEIRFSDTFQDSRGHYLKGAQVADFVEKWVIDNGGANNVKFRKAKPTAYDKPMAK